MKVRPDTLMLYNAQIKLTAQDVKHIEQLKQRTGLAEGDIIRRAIAYYSFFAKETMAGNKVLVEQQPDGIHFHVS